MADSISPTKQFIVYVDDDNDDLDFITESLAGYHKTLFIRTFLDSGDAYRYLTDLENTGEHPCLIILDVNMPMLSGKDLLERLRANSFFDETPVVMFSTSSAPSDIQYANNLNANFITKPLDSRQMEAIAEKLLSFCTEESRKQIKK